VNRRSLVLLCSINHSLSGLLVDKQIHVVTAGLVRLLEFPVENLGMVYTVPTLQGSHSHYLIDVIEALRLNLRHLVLFYKDLRTCFVLLKRELSFMLVLLLKFQHFVSL